jgi:D-serine deaminase-like pyridoxal phosphate-dependent protein
MRFPGCVVGRNDFKRTAVGAAILHKKRTPATFPHQAKEVMDLRTPPTPSLILDLNRVRRNAEMMTERANALDVDLRPHVKTHKCIEIAQLQVANHFGGITVSTLGEAFAFAKAGFTDILYAVPVEPGKFARVCELARICGRVILTTDNLEIPKPLDAAAQAAGVKFDVLVEVDCGDKRCGVDVHAPSLIEIAKLIADAKNLNFAGIMTHAGQSYAARQREKRMKIARQERDRMNVVAERLEAAGLEFETVSVGSTPTAMTIDNLEGVTEIRPGNYIFFDAFQAELGTCAVSDCALTVLAAVVHRDVSQRKVVIDAGAIALSKDPGPVDFNANCGFGRVLDIDGKDLKLHVSGVSQEHGKIIVEDRRLLERLSVGTRVRVLANHSCLTVAQHEKYHVLEHGELIGQWPIHRGW